MQSEKNVSALLDVSALRRDRSLLELSAVESFTSNEAAKLLGISGAAVRAAVKRQNLPASGNGKARAFPRDRGSDSTATGEGLRAGDDQPLHMGHPRFLPLARAAEADRHQPARIVVPRKCGSGRAPNTARTHGRRAAPAIRCCSCKRAEISRTGRRGSVFLIPPGRRHRLSGERADEPHARKHRLRRDDRNATGAVQQIAPVESPTPALRRCRCSPIYISTCRRIRRIFRKPFVVPGRTP